MNILNMIKNLVKKSIQTLSVDDTGNYQTAQVSFLGQTHTVKQLIPYGLYSNSPISSEWIILSLRANPNDKVGIANDYSNRPKNLKEGEVVLYNIKTNTSIKLDSNGDILLNAKNINETAQENIILNFEDATLEGTNINIIGSGTINLNDAEVNIDADNNDITLTTTGNININGGSVTIQSATSIDGKDFLSHTHPAGTPPGNTGPVN